MSQRSSSWRRLFAVGTIALLAACSQTSPRTEASNPPPVPPGPNATWYHVSFDSGSYTMNADANRVVNELALYLQRNPAAIATIIGKTDTVGSRNYNMHLSHQRADAVRDALVYRDNVSAERVETRWTGENRQAVATTGDVAEAANRVVDIAIH
jgi:OOP family OmpA-OmpF porin